MAKRIQTIDLDCYYGDFLAVQNVNIEIEPKAVTAFIGPSGCGKTTFLRSLNRMHEVAPGARADGKILLDDENINASNVDPVRVRSTVGMVFHRPNPFPTTSIRENHRTGSRLTASRLSRAGCDNI